MTDKLPIPKSDAVTNIIAEAHDDSAKNDFITARANIHDVLVKGLTAVEELSGLAQASQDPKFYKALGSMIDTVTKASKEMLELQQKIRNIDHADKVTNDDAKSERKKSGTNITNNLFVGSTADLQRVIGENQMKMLTGPDKNE